MIAGPDFGSESGKSMLVRKSQDDVSTKEIGTNEKDYILRGELEYVVFYPSEGLPQAIDLLVLERTKLEC